MTPGFIVRTTPHFERLFRSLQRQHAELSTLRNEVLSILSVDPYNRRRYHPIKKLTDVPQGKGQYRLRLRRFRFRYDIYGQEVVLQSCGLRREDAYE
jgi:hypothetical protein